MVLSCVVEAINSTSRYILNIDSPYFEGMVYQIYLPELQLNKANTTDTEAPFLDLHLSIVNRFKIYDKRDDFHFDIYSSKEVLHHLDFFVFLSDILTNKF